MLFDVEAHLSHVDSQRIRSTYGRGLNSDQHCFPYIPNTVMVSDTPNIPRSDIGTD